MEFGQVDLLFLDIYDDELAGGQAAPWEKASL